MKKKLVAMLLVVGLVASALSGCGWKTEQESEATKTTDSKKTEEKTVEGEEEKQETVVLDALWTMSNTSGMMNFTHWSKFIEENAGVVINLIPNGDNANEKLMTYLAADDMPDIVAMSTNEQMQLALESGALIDLDDYAELIPNVYEAFGENAIQYIRDTFGGFYGIPMGQTNEGQNAGNLSYGFYLRWDLYQDSGYPVYDDMADYLDLLEEWQTANPTNDNGEKVYALSIFRDWDGSNAAFGKYFGGYQYGNYYYGDLIEFNNDTKEIRSIVDDTSDYKAAIAMLFEANQRGLLDPNSLTQTFDEYGKKIADNRVLALPAVWTNMNTTENVEKGKVIYHTGFGNMRVYDYNGPFYLGNDDYRVGISADSENIEAALKYLNFISDEDNYWRISHGPQGEYWDVDEEGNVYRTEQGQKLFEDPEMEFADGGTTADSFAVVYNQWLNVRTKNSTYNARLNESDWVKKAWYPADDEHLAAWKEHYDGDSEIEIARENGWIADYRFVPIEATPEEITTLQTRLADGTALAIWECIYAADQADFDAKWDALYTKLYDLGMQDLVDYYKTAINNALEASSKYLP